MTNLRITIGRACVQGPFSYAAERLAALGSVGGSGGAPTATGVDPTDRIAIANMLHEAIVASSSARFRSSNG